MDCVGNAPRLLLVSLQGATRAFSGLPGEVVGVPVHFVSEPIVPRGDAFDPATIARGEPALPPEFAWRDERLVVRAVRRTWRSTKVDRGDTYVKRHYFECELTDGRIATVYFERQARRGEARWHLYTIAETEDL